MYMVTCSNFTQWNYLSLASLSLSKSLNAFCRHSRTWVASSDEQLSEVHAHTCAHFVSPETDLLCRPSSSLDLSNSRLSYRCKSAQLLIYTPLTGWIRAWDILLLAKYVSTCTCTSSTSVVRSRTLVRKCDISVSFSDIVWSPSHNSLQRSFTWKLHVK